jgi:nitric oxide reductase subunit B
MVMGKYNKLWWALIAVLAATFALLGYFGVEVYRKAPPIPDRVVTISGHQIMTRESILDGQTAWQSVGGMQLGSIWGHGAYQAPDWTADWLHRELLAWLELAAQEEFGLDYGALTGRDKNTLQYELKQAYRANTYNPETDVLTVSERRARAMAQTADYYNGLFGGEPTLQSTRESYAMKEVTLPSGERRAQLPGRSHLHQ